MATITDTRVRRRRAAATLVAMSALLLLPRLDGLDLWAPDEPRFAQVAEELRSMRHGPTGLFLLHLNDEIYTQKPPLYYWLAASMGSLAGSVTEHAARLPSALAGIATVAVTLTLGRGLFGAGSSAGLWGSMILLTVLRFSHLARRAQIDVLLTLFETLALLAFWQLERYGDSAPRQRRRALLLLHAALSLALLTKGPVGLLPLAVMAAYLAWDGRLREFRRLFPTWGLAISLGPALLWLCAAVVMSPPGFFEAAVIDNTLGRFASGTSHARPLYYYLYQLPLDFLPWTLLWPLAARAAFQGLRSCDRRTLRTWRLLVSWIALELVFFSLSAGKRGLYLLPAFPAIALICGAGVERVLDSRHRLPGSLSAGLLLGGLTLAAWGVWRASNPAQSVEPYPGLAISVPFAAAVATIAIGAIFLAWRRSALAVWSTVVATVAAVEIVFFQLLLPPLDESKSPRAIADEINRVSDPDEPVAVFSDRAMVAAMAYYARRSIVELPDSGALEPFLVAGGRTIVTRARDLPRIQSQTPVEITASLRESRREVLVVRAPLAP